MIIPVGVSKRHIHLTKETFKELFGLDEMEVRNYLKQPGEYASPLTIDVKWDNKKLERVRVVGPFRKYNQLEISRSEANYLGIRPPVKKSGDLEGTHPIILCFSDKEVYLDQGTAIARRHIHIDSNDALKYDLSDDERVLIYKDGKEICDAYIGVLDPSFLELHIDTDEALLYNLNQDDEIEVKKIVMPT
ncbi:MAG: PduL/EutD family phosphate acyltransferase [Bacilli bacterium]|nr:PduL/EutD family phosphate acyltransferase [Bacilli bacterium]